MRKVDMRRLKADGVEIVELAADQVLSEDRPERLVVRGLEVLGVGIAIRKALGDQDEVLVLRVGRLMEIDAPGNCPCCFDEWPDPIEELLALPAAHTDPADHVPHAPSSSSVPAVRILWRHRTFEGSVAGFSSDSQ